MAEESGPSVRLLRWCGMALVPGGVLMAVATLLHPSQETAATIIASEVGLVAAHFVYTLARLLVLLGLPGLYVSQRGGMGRLGLIGFLTAFAGTYLIAVTGNFGFFAPVLAKESPATLDAIGQYWPVVVIDGLAAITFMIGYVLIRHRHDQNGDPASLRRRTRRGGRSSASGRRRHIRPGLNGRMAGRHLGQRESRRRPGLARLPVVANTSGFRFASSRPENANVSIITTAGCAKRGSVDLRLRY